MSVDHCGLHQDTPYCGMCGELLNETMIHIQGLKRHVDAGVVRACGVSPPEKGEKAARKWMAWQAALKELMDK